MSDTKTPGSVLLRKFMRPSNLTVASLARLLGRSEAFVLELVMDSRAINSDTARDLALFFNTTPQYWEDLQTTANLGA